MTLDQANAWLKLIDKLALLNDDEADSLLMKKPTVQMLLSYGSLRISRMLPKINASIMSDPETLLIIRDVLALYSAPPYSLEKSKDLVLHSAKVHASEYDYIPLYYTSQCSPEPTSYSSNIWGKLKTLGSFEDPDYGRIDFIEALLSLDSEGKIKLQSFTIDYLSLYEVMVVEATVTLNDKSPVTPKILKLKNGYRYNSVTKKIVKGDRSLGMLGETKGEAILLYLITMTEADTYTSWDLISESIVGAVDSSPVSKSKKSFQDAVYRINKAFKATFNTDASLITWENNRLKRNI